MQCRQCYAIIPKDDEWYVSSETGGLCISCSLQELHNSILDIIEKAEIWGIYTGSPGWDGQTQYSCHCGKSFNVKELIDHAKDGPNKEHFLLEGLIHG